MAVSVLAKKELTGFVLPGIFIITLVVVPGTVVVMVKLELM
jgi:hypothetical protein